MESEYPTNILSSMDTAIDLSDASKALDLNNIRFQLMYVFGLHNNIVGIQIGH